jgi:hypothetical protein
MSARCAEPKSYKLDIQSLDLLIIGAQDKTSASENSAKFAFASCALGPEE